MALDHHGDVEPERAVRVGACLRGVGVIGLNIIGQERAFRPGTYRLPFGVPGVGDLVGHTVGELVRLGGPRPPLAPGRRRKVHIVPADAGNGLERGAERLDIERIRLELERLVEVAPGVHPPGRHHAPVLGHLDPDRAPVLGELLGTLRVRALRVKNEEGGGATCKNK